MTMKNKMTLMAIMSLTPNMFLILMLIMKIFTMGFMTRYITGFHTIADLANWSGSTVVDNGMLCKKSVRISSRNPGLVNHGSSTNL